ncbi:hypothetical protein QTL95_18490 [Rhizobium sp. S152]|uniref:hypothetical protein n=1 Tax=Rhizobium sp. S152 TaxID=3055038 RepID=UPI0025A99915|nr:hypothetical protein [Rhizobium sp. S152]MDM9627884.1 hypothetical protein [Rhizobium sp. S152]
MSRKKTVADASPHVVEWVVGFMSTLLVVAMIGFIGFEVFSEEGGPPRLAVSMLDQRSKAAPNELLFEIANSADTTAAAVVVRGELHIRGSADVETSEAQFDYVPAHSKARGALIFSTPVEGENVAIRVVGYADP